MVKTPTLDPTAPQPPRVATDGSPDTFPPKIRNNRILRALASSPPDVLPVLADFSRAAVQFPAPENRSA